MNSRGKLVDIISADAATPEAMSEGFQFVANAAMMEYVIIQTGGAALALIEAYAPQVWNYYATSFNVNASNLSNMFNQCSIQGNQLTLAPAYSASIPMVQASALDMQAALQGAMNLASFSDKYGALLDTVSKGASSYGSPTNMPPEGTLNSAIDIGKLNSKPLYRVMTESELNAVKDTGYLRGGRSGPTYFTDSYYKNASNAQNRISLPNEPEYIVEFKITNKPTVTGGNTVKPDYGGSGGGREYFSNDPVQVDIVNYQKMK